MPLFTGLRKTKSDPERKYEVYNAGRQTNQRGVGRGRGKQISGRNSKAQTSPRGIDYVTKRMLSARRIKINELRSETEHLQNQVIELQKENKILVRQQKKSDRLLDRYEGQENDLPGILQRQGEETRALKEQFRRQKEKYHKSDRKLKESDEELQRTRRLLHKMRGLVDDKQLKERDELNQKLSKAESELEDKNAKVLQLERHIENLNKNHRHEFGIERARHKETGQQLKDISEERTRLQYLLREKDKELEVRNIYANRVMRPPHKLNSSVTSSPLPDASRPPRYRPRKNSTPGQTPREKAKLMEGERREEMRKLREEAEQKEQDRLDEEQHIKQIRDDEERIRREAGQKEEYEHNQLRQRQEDRKSKDDEDRRKREDKKEEEACAQEERDRKNHERQEKENKEREERERREREEQERWKNEERQRQEEEERERRQREDLERKAKEEQFKLANSAAEQERLRQKALLLAKMKVIDESKKQAESDPFFIPDSGSEKKDYSFTEPVENMHRGKPAYKVSVPVLEKKKKGFLDDDDDDVGGYQPSFTGTGKGSGKQHRKNSFDSDASSSKSKARNGKKSELMDSLFGGNQTPPKPATRKENSSTQLFGGGAVFDDDEAPPKSNHLLPRRTRQNATPIHSKPTINAVDNLDDDIEEVML